MLCLSSCILSFRFARGLCRAADTRTDPIGWLDWKVTLKPSGFRASGARLFEAEPPLRLLSLFEEYSSLRCTGCLGGDWRAREATGSGSRDEGELFLLLYSDLRCCRMDEPFFSCFWSVLGYTEISFTFVELSLLGFSGDLGLAGFGCASLVDD